MTASRATVFVTGPGSGFGVAIARRFTAAGARVVISGRWGDKLAAVAADR